MRLSIVKGDPSYKSLTACQAYRVFIDDVELHDCVTADEERGFVIRQISVYNPLLRKRFFKNLPPQHGKVVITFKGK